MKELSWKCDICGEERPDAKISVLSKPLISSGLFYLGRTALPLSSGRVCGEQNIKYCNDKASCVEGAKEYSHFKEHWDYMMGIGIPEGCKVDAERGIIGPLCPCGCGKAVAFACSHGGSMACPSCLREWIGSDRVKEMVHKGEGNIF